MSTRIDTTVNPATTIKFDLKENSRVMLVIYNMLGQVVTTLIDEHMEAGFHQVVWDASHAASGIYLYRIKAGNFTAIKRMILLK